MCALAVSTKREHTTNTAQFGSLSCGDTHFKVHRCSNRRSVTQPRSLSHLGYLFIPGPSGDGPSGRSALRTTYVPGHKRSGGPESSRGRSGNHYSMTQPQSGFNSGTFLSPGEPPSGRRMWRHTNDREDPCPHGPMRWSPSQGLPLTCAGYYQRQEEQ